MHYCMLPHCICAFLISLPPPYGWGLKSVREVVGVLKRGRAQAEEEWTFFVNKACFFIMINTAFGFPIGYAILPPHSTRLYLTKNSNSSP